MAFSYAQIAGAAMRTETAVNAWPEQRAIHVNFVSEGAFVLSEWRVWVEVSGAFGLSE